MVTGFATGISSPVDLKVAEDGSLYYLARGGGAVYRISYGATAPTITSHPVSRTVAPGASVTFSVGASGPAPLRYQWQRNRTNIAGATSQSYTIASVAQADNNAQFRAIVSNDFGSTTSNEALLTVSANRAPTAAITAPATGALYTLAARSRTAAPARTRKTARCPPAPSPGRSISTTTRTRTRSWRPRAARRAER